MRHNKKINHLGRTSTHRAALLSNMACSLIEHKRIFTTVPKAKELRKFIEPLITKSKIDTTHSRRIVFKNLQSKFAVKELFQEVSSKIGDRPGGYTRIIKTGYRLGDNAAMCFIELVDYNENMLSTKTSSKAAKTRRSRKKSDVDATVDSAVVTEKATSSKKKATKEVVAEVPEIDNAKVKAEEISAEAPATETPEKDKPAEE